MTSTLIKTMQLLCYKENKELFNKKYEKKDVFINPLLFAYFNNKKYNFFGNEQFEKILIGESEYQNIKLSKIKLLKNKHPVLNGTFKKNEIPIDYEVIEISKIINDFYIDKLSNALGYLKANVSGHFELIEENCKAICLFNTSPTNTNSFATINAHGMAFFNVYQKDEYDEVFFVDDISHQTGHIIMNSFWFDRKKHFVIDENQNIKDITKNPNEYRSFYILFHALYTYYTSILCLEGCIDNQCFNDEQKKEARARIVFYLRKYAYDIINFEKVCQYYKGIDKVINEESQNLYQHIKNKYIESQKRWENELSIYKFENQPYNFTFSIFKKDNPNLKQ